MVTKTLGYIDLMDSSVATAVAIFLSSCNYCCIMKVFHHESYASYARYSCFATSATRNATADSSLVLGNSTYRLGAVGTGATAYASDAD